MNGHVDPASGVTAGAVTIEEHIGWGDRREWRLSLLRQVDSVEQARAEARRLAHSHKPEHPVSERRRTVLHRDADEFLVYVEGQTKDFHFRVHAWAVDSDGA